MRLLLLVSILAILLSGPLVQAVPGPTGPDGPGDVTGPDDATGTGQDLSEKRKEHDDRPPRITKKRPIDPKTKPITSTITGAGIKTTTMELPPKGKEPDPKSQSRKSKRKSKHRKTTQASVVPQVGLVDAVPVAKREDIVTSTASLTGQSKMGIEKRKDPSTLITEADLAQPQTLEGITAIVDTLISHKLFKDIETWENDVTQLTNVERQIYTNELNAFIGDVNRQNFPGKNFMRTILLPRMHFNSGELDKGEVRTMVLLLKACLTSLKPIKTATQTITPSPVWPLVPDVQYQLYDSVSPALTGMFSLKLGVKLLEIMLENPELVCVLLTPVEGTQTVYQRLWDLKNDLLSRDSSKTTNDSNGMFEKVLPPINDNALKLACNQLDIRINADKMKLIKGLKGGDTKGQLPTLEKSRMALMKQQDVLFKKLPVGVTFKKQT